MRDLSYRALAPKLLALALPVMLQNMLITALSVVDNAMVGMLGELSLSAVSVANQVFFVYSLFLFGIGSAASVIVSQYWGKGDKAAVRWLFWLFIFAAVILGSAFTAICMLCPQAAMRIYTNDPALAELGARYLRRVGPANIANAVCVIMFSTLRGVQRVKIGMVLSALSLVTNVFLNWVMIYGHLGCPAMGVDGAAYATAIARLVQFAGLVLWLAVEKQHFVRFSTLRHIPGAMVRSCAKESAPIVINECLWGLGTSLYMVSIGRMGTDAVSAYSMVVAFKDMMTIAGSGLGNGVSVMVGMSVGAGEREKSMRISKLSVRMGLICGVVFAALALLLFPVYMRFFDISAAGQHYAHIMMYLLAANVILSGLNMICIVGILRGGGDGRVAGLMDIMFLWPVCLPLSLIGGLLLGWKVYMIYGIIVADELAKLILVYRRVRSGKWIRNLTRTF